jgi:hypothetical protein
VLDGGIDVIGRRSHDERPPVGADGFVLDSRQRDSLGAVPVLALADEVPHDGPLRVRLERLVDELLDPLVDIPKERLVLRLPLAPVIIHCVRVLQDDAAHAVQELVILGRVTGPVQRTGLVASIAEAAASCRSAFRRHVDVCGVPGAELNRWALFAIALLEATADAQDLGDGDLRGIRDAASSAAAVSRTQIPEETALALAAAFSEVERICGAALGAGATSAARRFLFPDADVTVTRVGVRWRVRSGAIEFEDALLAIALGLTCSWLSTGRVGELALQILDWDAQAGAG